MGSPWQRTVPNPELPTTPQLGEEFVPWAAPKDAAAERPTEFSEEEITCRAEQRKRELFGHQSGAATAPTTGKAKIQAAELDRRAKEIADEEQEAMREIAGDDN